MKNTSTELKVGIFAIIVIVFLTYMTFKVGSLPLIWEKGYRLYVAFDDISGLDEQSRIKIAGVDAGIVEKIVLRDGKAILTLLVSPDIRIHSDAIASLRMSGLLGDRYIALTTGSPDKPLLKGGETIKYAIPAADIDTLATQISSTAHYLSALTKNLENIFGEQERLELKESIRNLKVVTQNIKDISQQNKEPIRRLIAQLEEFSAALGEKGPDLLDEMRDIARIIKKRGPALMTDLGEAARSLESVIEENRYAIKDSVENIKQASKSANKIAARIEKGEGTLGKLMNDDSLYNSLNKVSTEAGKSLDVVGRLRTFMDFHSEYNTEEADWKGFFNLTLKPRDDMYYVLGVVSDPRGSVETTRTTINSGTTTLEEEIVEDKVEFIAQFARRFNDFAVRIGVMESTFGLGADYFLYDDKARLKLDVWDFSADEANADRAHMKIGVDYRIFKYLFVSGGIDNLLNSNRRGLYVGGGLTFEDEDFKYLFGSSPKLPIP